MRLLKAFITIGWWWLRFTNDKHCNLNLHLVKTERFSVLKQGFKESVYDDHNNILYQKFSPLKSPTKIVEDGKSMIMTNLENDKYYVYDYINTDIFKPSILLLIILALEWKILDAQTNLLSVIFYNSNRL